MNTTFFYSSLMLVAGLGIPVMAALNGSLGVKLQSPALAAAILFSVGLLIAATYLIAVEGLPESIQMSQTPWYLYFGGLFVMFYILSITWVAPRFGVANAVSFVLLGQLIAMTIIDHYGFAGNIRYPADPQRILGLLIMAAGVFLVLSRPETSS